METSVERIEIGSEEMSRVLDGILAMHNHG
jgi:hypothetical protein